MTCHPLRLWTCLLACPASSKTPVTCHRPCWMISECARVTPSSVTSCSGRPLTLTGHAGSAQTVPTASSNRLCLCVQIGAGQGGRIKRCAEGSCEPRYLSDHVRCDRAETCWPHNWGPLPTPWLCSPPTFWERCVIIVISFKMTFTSLFGTYINIKIIYDSNRILYYLDCIYLHVFTLTFYLQ